MLSLDSQQKLSKLFQKLSQLELGIERQRQRLASIPTFEPYSAFCRINRKFDKLITVNEIYAFLIDNGTYDKTILDCQTIINYFDSDRDQGLSFKEFMEVMLCCDDVYLRSDVTQRPSFDCPPSASLHPEIERELARLLVLEMEYHIKLNKIKANLTSRKEWTSLMGFKAVDRYREGFLGFNSIQLFCGEHGFIATENEIFSIIRRLDSDADSRITLAEFNDFFGTKPKKGPQTKGFKEDFKHTSPRKTIDRKDMKRFSRLSNSKASSSSLHSRKKSEKQLRNQSSNSNEANRQRMRTSSKRSLKPVWMPASKSPSGYIKKSPGYGHRQSLKSNQGSLVPALSQKQLAQTCPFDVPKHLRKPTDFNISHFAPIFFAETLTRSPCRSHHSSQKRNPSPGKSSPLKRSGSKCSHQRHSPERCSPLRHTPERCSPLKHSPVRCSPCRHSPVRCSPCRHSPVRCSPRPFNQRAIITQMIANKHDYKAQYGRSSPPRAPILAPQITGKIEDVKRKQILPCEEEDKLVSALIQQVSWDLEIEQLKIKLANQPDFNLIDAFHMIDKNGKGNVNGPQLLEAITHYGLKPQAEDVYLFMRRFGNSEGRICFSDFCEAMTPKDALSTRCLNNREAAYRSFSEGTEQLFLHTLMTHFSNEEQADVLRNMLSRRAKFDTHQCFEALDLRQNGYITKEEFRQFLADNQVYYTDLEIQILVARYDTNCDGRVCITEFSEEFTPRQKN